MYEDTKKIHFQMQHIHFIAIGGAIMHQLALALHRKGHRITGSDDEINDPAKSNLAAAGLLPAQMGWYTERIVDRLDAVVLGMHARANNPELLEAKRKGIPVYSFPQYVYEVSKQKQRVVIAGSHGKTTITSMVMHILRRQGIDFDYLVGAKVDGFSDSVRLTDAPIIVLEGDEYPASAEERRPKIFFYHPHISVLSGIAWDHINVFPTYDNYFNQFEQYLLGMEAGTRLIYNGEDTEVIRVVAGCGGKLQATAYSTPPFHYDGGQPVVETAEGMVRLSVFGRHNVQNARAAVEVCMALGVAEDAAYAAIASFGGAARRLELVKQEADLLIYRDFAHAPSKLKATLNAVREAYPNHRLVACFELHTFSSLSQAFLAQYAGSMHQADDAIVFYSHHALQLKGLPALAPADVVAGFDRASLQVIDNKEELLKQVQEMVVADERPVFLLLMSSGTFDGIDWNGVSSQKK